MRLERPMTSAERVAKRRAVLRSQGLKPRTIWLPDRTSPVFGDRVRQDIAIINEMRRESDAVAFIEAIQYWPDEGYDWGPGGPP